MPLLIELEGTDKFSLLQDIRSPAAAQLLYLAKKSNDLQIHQKPDVKLSFARRVTSFLKSKMMQREHWDISSFFSFLISDNDFFFLMIYYVNFGLHYQTVLIQDFKLWLILYRLAVYMLVVQSNRKSDVVVA